MDLESASPRRGITEKDVWQAADALLMAGRRPTIEAVRMHLGRGSPNTVITHLDTWFKGLGARLQDPAAYSPPPAVPQPIAAAALHFWETALATARGELQADRDSLARATEELEADRKALAAEHQRFAAAEAAMNQALTLAKEHLERSTARGDRLVTRNEALELEIKQLKDQLIQERATLVTERHERAVEAQGVQAARKLELARFEATERRWIQETDAARGLAREGAAEVERLTKTLAAAKAEQQKQRDAGRDREAALQAELQAAKALVTNLSGELEHGRRLVEDLKSQVAAALNARKSEIDQLNIQLREALRTVGRVMTPPKFQASTGMP